MARYSGGDGMTKVLFVPGVSGIADISAPTLTELATGADWSAYVMKDGLSEPSDQNNTDIAALAHTYNAQVPGSFGGALELTAQRDNADGEDIVWDTVSYGVEGHIVIRSGIPVASAYAAGDPLRVYPGAWHEPVPVGTSGDTADQLTAMFPISSQPDLKAVAAV
jgi:hypothetical protein